MVHEKSAMSSKRKVSLLLLILSLITIVIQLKKVTRFSKLLNHVLCDLNTLVSPQKRNKLKQKNFIRFQSIGNFLRTGTFVHRRAITNVERPYNNEFRVQPINKTRNSTKWLYIIFLCYSVRMPRSIPCKMKIILVYLRKH